MPLYPPALNLTRRSLNTPIEQYIQGMSLSLYGTGDFDHMYCQPTSTDALKNLIRPGTYDGVLVNAPTFTAYQGFTGLGTGAASEINTQFDPSSGTPNFTRNANSFGVWMLTDIQTSGFDFGNDQNAFAVRSTVGPDDTFTRSSLAGSQQTAGIHAVGMWSVVRNNALDYQLFHNGVQVASISAGSTALLSTTFRVFRRPGSGAYSTNQVMSVWAGNWTAAQQPEIYALKLACAQAVGAV